MHVELVEHRISNRGTIVSLEELTTQSRPYEAYISHFPYSKAIVDYVAIKKTVKDFSGEQYCPKIIVDIDNDNLEISHNNANQYVSRLVTDYGCQIDQIEIAFSGKKGFHISFNSEILGGIEPAIGINQNAKLFVQHITSGIPNVDFNIYDSTRLVRMLNSINPKSGLYKIPLTYNEFLKGLDWILEQAKSPRMRNKVKKDIVAKLRETWLVYRKPMALNQLETSIVGFFSPPEKGNRNQKLFSMTCSLFENSKFAAQQVSEIVQSINLASIEPLSKNEVDSVIASAKSRIKPVTDKVIAYTLEELAPEWLEYMMPEKKPLTLLDSEFDKVVNGKIRGKLIPILGYPGTKKSLLAHNICVKNMEENDARVLYSSMEMGAGEIINRTIDITYEDSSGNLPSYELGKAIEDDKNAVMTMYYELVNRFKNRMHICPTTIHDVSQYEQLISDIEQKSGKVTFLIVDGLSMMRGKGTATENVNKHTADLKALANKTGVTILLIVHLSKGLESHTRDLLKNARDSQKIVDNGDYFFMLSMCVDNDATGGEISYIENMNYCRFWAKRGSGKIVNKIFEFKPGMLKLVSTNYDPNEYDPKKRRFKDDF